MLDLLILGRGAMGLGLLRCALLKGLHARAIGRDEPGEPASVSLVATKAWDARLAAQKASQCSEHVFVLCNGIGFSDFDRVAVYTGFRFHHLPFQNPNKTTESGTQSERVIQSGPLRVSTACEAAAQVFERLGALVERSESNERVEWDKAWVNLTLGPLGALHGLRNGEVFLSPELRGLAGRLLDEAISVCPFSAQRDEAWLRIERTAHETAQNIGSMAMDLQLGRRTEIEFLSGVVARLGRAKGRPLTETERVLSQLHSKEKTR